MQLQFRSGVGVLVALGCISCSNSSPASPAKDPTPKTVTRTQAPLTPTVCVPGAVKRSEHRIKSSPGVEVFVIRAQHQGKSRGAAVLLHGAGSPSSATWDLPGDYSMIGKLACEGFDAYAVDVRGFGGSTPQTKPVRAHDVQPDVAATVEFAKAQSDVEHVDLIAWSWGNVVAGLYTAEHTDQVRRLVIFAPVYDRKWPTRHAPKEAFEEVTPALYKKYQNAEIEEPFVFDAYLKAMFRFSETKDKLRISKGPYHDIYGADGPIWRPQDIRAETLVIRGGKDRASLAEHAHRLYDHLDAAPVKEYLELSNLDHFAFRRKAQYRRLHDAILGFLKR